MQRTTGPTASSITLTVIGPPEAEAAGVSALALVGVAVARARTLAARSCIRVTIIHVRIARDYVITAVGTRSELARMRRAWPPSS